MIGMPMSIRIKSGLTCSALTSASAPLPAPLVAWSSSSSVCCIRSISISSSSTMRMLATGILLGGRGGAGDVAAHLGEGAALQLVARQCLFVQSLGHDIREAATVVVVEVLGGDDNDGDRLAAGLAPQ